MGLVLPAELLSVNYAAEVRRFLLQSFERVDLVLFTERVFPDAQEEVLLLLAEGYLQGPTLGLWGVDFLCVGRRLAAVSDGGTGSADATPPSPYCIEGRGLGGIRWTRDNQKHVLTCEDRSN